MARRKPTPPPPPRYEDWLEFHFARLPEQATTDFLFEDDGDCWQSEPVETLLLIAEMLRRSGTDLLQFTDAQVGVGLDGIFNASMSDDGHTIIGSAAEPELHTAVFLGFWQLYRDCLAQRAPDALGHLDEARGPLANFCYMFWDTSAIGHWQATPGKSSQVDALFRAFEAGLSTGHHGCMESALHGIGHLHSSMEERGRETVERFRQSKRNRIRPELVRYAEAAAQQLVQ
ncbi:MAG: hypothetical protein ACR2O4_18700 [Hyphomicrobiaceae bacterium]